MNILIQLLFRIMKKKVIYLIDNNFIDLATFIYIYNFQEDKIEIENLLGSLARVPVPLKHHRNLDRHRTHRTVRKHKL
jgi:hypothetical protein